jgi:hypothetical protein
MVHYFYGSVSSLNILAFLSFVFTRLVNYSIEYVLDVVFYIENNTWVRGNTRFISSVEHDIPTSERSERVRYHVEHEK